MGKLNARTIAAGGMAVALLLFLGACASAGGGAGGNPNLITAEQLEASGAANLEEAIQQLRPRWLRTRGARSLDELETGILVYFNDSRLGNADEVLRDIPLDGIRRIEYLDSAQAGRLPGAGAGQHVEGAIMVYTRDDA